MVTQTRIGLGTAGLGLNEYGLKGQPQISDKEAHFILRSAADMGVTYIDTARAYGEAEKMIGDCGITKIPAITVGTKCGQFICREPGLSFADIKRRIREEVDTSRKLLRLDQLDLVQLHIESPEFCELEPLFEIMSELGQAHIIKRSGIACRGEMVPMLALRNPLLSSIQMSYNVFDQRPDPKILLLATQNQVDVIVRSVFLQGVFSGQVHKLPASLRPTLEEKTRVVELIADELGISLAELALQFVCSSPLVDTILVGTTSVAHLQKAIMVAQRPRLAHRVTELLKELAINDPKLVDPAQWPKQ